METVRNLNYYMSLNYKICIQQDEDGWFAEVADLPGCMTYAETREEVLVLIDDAKRAWLEDALADGDEIPEPSQAE